MNFPAPQFVLPLLGYLIGSFPTGVVVSRRKYRIDVREMGSGNIGATNVTRVFGWWAGLLTFLIDVAKGALPLLAVRSQFPNDAWLVSLVAASLVLGHCYSVYLKFQGGKGVATSLGCLVVVVPWVALAVAIVYLILLRLTKISAVGSLGGVLVGILALPVIQAEKPVVYFVLGMSIVVLIRHKANIQRMWASIKSGSRKGQSSKLGIPILLFLTVSTRPVVALSPKEGSTFSENISTTMAEAKKQKKPILISFFGIWCPPCNELEELVFHTPTFFDKSKDFRLLKVDADDPKSWPLKHKYKVGGYPTVVFTDHQGEEVYRVVGYRSPNEFYKIMDLVKSSKNVNLSQACQSSKETDLWRCAVICRERKETCADEAFKKLEKRIKPGSSRYEEARAYFVETASTPDLKRLGYERLMAEYPKSPMAMMWAYEYLKLFQDEKQEPKKDLIQKVISGFAEIMKDPRRDEMGLSETDLVQIKAEIYDQLGQKDEARATWKEAANLLAKLASQLPPGAPARGFALERISCLEGALETGAALELSKEYQNKYPAEFTFHYWTASLLDRSKKFEEALPIARKAFEQSYGDNRVRTATLLIKLLVTQGQKEEAKKLQAAVKKEISPQASLQIRTHRYLKKLDEALN